jgi:mRNA interferase MazF
MIHRGEIRWYKFKPPDKNRPVVILTRDSAIPYLTELTVAPITSTIRDIPSETRIGKEFGLHIESAINLDHIQTISKAKIGALIGTLTHEKMLQMRKALMFALGFL